mmetsp:Transcript_34674/g.70083  ORF Transcript_34674/g.70083 Transcript_34674/m.70083 type:complete len:250 (+) Transcript_34674:220-969(+)
MGKSKKKSPKGPINTRTVSTSSRLPRPTRTICDLASQQSWAAALERCETHHEDMHYSETRGSLLHFALWSHRKAKFTMDESIAAGNEELFCRFLDKLMSANPDKLSAVGSLGYTPLHIACSKESLRNARVVEMLLRRSVPLQSKDLSDLLHQTINANIPLDISRRIVSFLPNGALMKDSQGKTPLFLACQFSKNIPRKDKRCTDTLKEVVEMLVKYAPEAKGIVDKTGRTPLQVVLKQKKYPELVDILS